MVKIVAAPRSTVKPLKAIPACYPIIWDVVAAIPVGVVRSYGEVAKRAGFPKGARQVGQALKRAPAKLKLPWHRVTGANGRISLPVGSAAYNEQIKRLSREGLILKGRRVLTTRDKSLDELMWG